MIHRAVKLAGRLIPSMYEEEFAAGHGSRAIVALFLQVAAILLLAHAIVIAPSVGSWLCTLGALYLLLVLSVWVKDWRRSHRNGRMVS